MCDRNWKNKFCFAIASIRFNFYVREAEDIGILHLQNKRLKSVKQSAISDHLLTCDYNMNFNDFTILYKDSNNFNLLTKKSFLIVGDKPILNKAV